MITEQHAGVPCPRALSPARNIERSVYSGDDAFSDDGPLSAAWDALWHASHGASAFQHRGWLGAWWAAYGTPGGLRVVLVYEDGRLVAAAPFFLRRLGLLRVLQCIGTGISDYGDVLIAVDVHTRPGAGALVTAGEDVIDKRRDQLAEGIAALGYAVDLREVPPGSRAAGLAEHWPHRVRSMPDSMCLAVPAKPFDDLITFLPKHTRTRVRAKARKIDEAGLRADPVAPDQVRAGVRDLLRFHEAQWSGRGINPEHLTTRFAEHLAAAAAALAADGCARLVRYVLDDELVGCDLLLCNSDSVSGYLTGVQPGLRERFDIAILLMRTSLDEATARGSGTVSMLRGLEPYKLRWRPEQLRNTRILLSVPGTGTPTATAVAAAASARRVMARTVKRWLSATARKKAWRRRKA